MLTGNQKSLWDALVEEHLAVQQMMQEAEQHGQPTEAAYERLGKAFIAAAQLLQAHSKPAGEGDGDE